MAALLAWIDWRLASVRKRLRLMILEWTWWQMYQLTIGEWREYYIRRDAADAAWDILELMQRPANARQDQRAAWKLGGRLRRLETEATASRQRTRP